MISVLLFFKICMFIGVQATARRKFFNSYKDAENRFLDQLALIYPNKAHEHSKRKI
ncbi:hypothetical protein [Pedobacter sp.]|uniref:hypothetical protein n=1 Tax=Pedobacter sp. TaxID=1411316 RepID=UPI003BAD3F17